MLYIITVLLSGAIRVCFVCMMQDLMTLLYFCLFCIDYKMCIIVSSLLCFLSNAAFGSARNYGIYQCATGMYE